MSTHTRRVLVLDANQRSALAVTRSLGKIGGIELICADSTTESLAGSSKYSRAYFTHPCVKTKPNDFITWIERFVADESIDAVFPTTEITSQIILMNRQVLGDCIFPFANYETVMALANKGELVKLAKQEAIPTPTTHFFATAKELDSSSVSDYPIVVKPCLSQIYANNSWISTSVKIAKTQQELDDILQNTGYLQNYPFMLQEFIPGHGAGIFVLYDQGKPVTFFSHRRIREKPPQGGVSVLSESTELNEQLKQVADKILTAVNWHGVAMVEFRIATDGTPYLMEVNTRFWGSLQLSIDSGVDFPKLLWQISNQEHPSAVNHYRVGQRLRWLLGDLDSLYLVLRNKDFSTGFKLKRFLSFFIPRPLRTKHEVNRLSDMGPFWHELQRYITDLKS